MNILVTGASGFLGAEIVRELSFVNAKVIGVSKRPAIGTTACDLTLFTDVKAIVKSTLPDLIIHCAANVPSKMSDYQDHERNLLNIKMTRNILDASACPIIFISSMTVYGSAPIVPVPEQAIRAPADSYAVSKYDCERVIKESGRSGLALRIPGLFGGARQSGLAFKLVHSALTGNAITLPTTSISWSGMHVVDSAKRIVNLLPCVTDRFVELNLGCAGKTSVNRLVNLVNEIFDSKIETAIQHPDFEFDLSRYYELASLPAANLRRSLEVLGDEIEI